MKQDKDKTDVIFRKWSKKRGGGVIAIFPSIPGTNDPNTCESYEHIGQHGPCTPTGIVEATSSAKDVDYMPLMIELESLGYNLRLIKRLQPKYLEIRKQQVW